MTYSDQKQALKLALKGIIYYQKALEIKIKHNDFGSQASTYHQLGIIAEQQKQWLIAEGHFQKTVEILDDSDDHFGQAAPFYMLGLIAEEQEKWNIAIDQFCQSLELYMAFNDEYWADITLSRLVQVWQVAVAQDAAFSAQSPAPARLAEILGVSVAEALAVLEDEE